MRKTALFFIIIMSMILVSGVGAPTTAEKRLTSTFQQLGINEVKAEISLIVPWEYRFEHPESSSEPLPKDWIQKVRQVTDQQGNIYAITEFDTTSLTKSITKYLELRTAALARGGNAFLDIQTEIPTGFEDIRAREIITKLGGGRVVQETSTQTVYSAATLAEGWGEPIFAGEDEINLQIGLRPDYQSGNTHLYLKAPILIDGF